MSANPWTAASRARVLELYGKPGTTGSSIAPLLAVEFGMDVTKSAVIGVANRGTPRPPRPVQTPEETLLKSRDRKRELRAAAREGRPAPAWAQPGAHRPAQGKAPAPKKPPVQRKAAVAKIVPVAKPKPAARVTLSISNAPAPLLIPLTAAPAGACRFIADDPKVFPALVCGHPVYPGSAWCPGHRRICVVPERTRPFAWMPRRAA